MWSRFCFIVPIRIDMFGMMKCEPLTAVPEPNMTNTPINRLSHWNHIQNMVQGFWKRWRMEYLTSLQERPKWQQIKRNLEVADVVVIKEPNLPPTKWLLGRIESVTNGSDGRVRVASVRTKQGILLRPITKLALLPLSWNLFQGGRNVLDYSSNCWYKLIILYVL